MKKKKLKKTISLNVVLVDLEKKKLKRTTNLNVVLADLEKILLHLQQKQENLIINKQM